MSFILGIVNNAVDIGLHVSFELVFSFSMDIYTGVELLYHIVVLFFVFFEGFPYCSPFSLHQLAFPSTVYWSLFFPRSLSASLLPFCNSCSNKFKVIAHCRFDFHFSDD